MSDDTLDSTNAFTLPVWRMFHLDFYSYLAVNFLTDQQHVSDSSECFHYYL